MQAADCLWDWQQWDPRIPARPGFHACSRTYSQCCATPDAAGRRSCWTGRAGGLEARSSGLVRCVRRRCLRREAADVGVEDGGRGLGEEIVDVVSIAAGAHTSCMTRGVSPICGGWGRRRSHRSHAPTVGGGCWLGRAVVGVGWLRWR
jgi:hypothetical protein